jgi:hypothetical protein
MSLDDDLAAWAASVRLPEAAADDIFARIVTTGAQVGYGGPGLDPRWWRRFSADFAGRMVASTTRPVFRAA